MGYKSAGLRKLNNNLTLSSKVDNNRSLDARELNNSSALDARESDGTLLVSQGLNNNINKTSV